MKAPFALLLALLLAAACTTGTKTRPDEQATQPTNCRCEDGCVSDCAVRDQTTTYRTVPRESAPSEPVEQPPEAYALYEERIEPLAPDALEQVARDLGLDADTIAGAFRADFVRGRGADLAIVSNDGRLTVYRGGDVVAKTTVGKLTSPVSAIQLIDDRAELVVRHEVDGIERLTVCRVIGESLARVFEMELAGRTLLFVHLGDERAIRVLEEDGTYSLFRWNPWEGMFRVPSRAPTAP